MKKVDMAGQRFGRLEIISQDPEKQRDGRPKWICRCECGTIKSINGKNLRRGLVNSCGCLQSELNKIRSRTHGLAGTPEYQIWNAMKGRCENPNDAGYRYYGGRGISVHPRWKFFENFIKDMGPRPDGLTLERVNNYEGYGPDNCKWATREEQANNKRSSVKLEICGDMGSCHMGSLEKAKELIRIGSESGLDSVKMQLLTSTQIGNGNILLDWNHLPELVEYAKLKRIDFYPSAFDAAGVELTKKHCREIKFAYSQRGTIQQYDLSGFDRVFGSFDVMSEIPAIGNLVPYFVVPEYPVPYVVNFEDLFPHRFLGFSSHCLGIAQECRAVHMGARFLEVHFQGTWNSDCPDGRFSKTPQTLERLCKRLKV